MRGHLLVLAATASALAVAPAAFGHITANPGEAPADSFAKIDFRVPHGCDESATTRVTVKLPEGIVSATPEVNPGWEISKTMRELAEPIEGEGGPITEVVDTVTWEGGPLAPDELTEFGLSVRLPNSSGETLYFPTVQTCEAGETRWIQIPAEGQDPFELETPAPFVTLTAGESTHGGSTTGEAEATAASEEAAAGPVEGSDDDSGSGLALAFGIAGLAAGLLALAVSLVRRRRHS